MNVTHDPAAAFREAEAAFAHSAPAAVIAARPQLDFRTVPADPDGFPHLKLAGGAQREMHFYFDNTEYTLSFCDWHSHMDELGQLLTLVDDILADRAVVASAFCEGSWRGSAFVCGGDENAWLEFVTDPAKGPCVFKLRSWSGRLDRDISY